VSVFLLCTALARLPARLISSLHDPRGESVTGCEMIRSASPSIYVARCVRSLGQVGGSIPRPRRADGPLAFLMIFGRRLGATGVNPLALNALAQAIQTQEGYYPGTLAYTNNNPGNLVYAGQPGATQGAGGFAAFSSYAAGYQALQNQIQLDAARGTDVNGNPVTTVGQLITSWAPPSQNDTAAYIASVTAQTGFSASDDLLSLGSSGSDQTSASLPADTSSVDSGDGTSSWLWYAAGLGALVIFRLSS